MKAVQINVWTETVTDQETFLRELGERLCRLRKEQGLTQTQLGDEVGVTQQVIAEYESGQRNIPVYRLASLADALGVSTAELLEGAARPARKRGPASKLDRLTEQIAKLPRSRQRFVVEMIEDAVARAK